MGGAALMLALGHVAMAWRLPASLRLLVPAVENSVSGDSYRPLDVLDTRAGITIEQVCGQRAPPRRGGAVRCLRGPPLAAPPPPGSGAFTPPSTRPWTANQQPTTLRPIPPSPLTITGQL
jgi:hypothetical protein